MNEIEEAIRSHVRLGRPNGSGFYPVKCAVCDDYKVRGGFKFESDGSVVYNCFRGKCDANAIWHPGESLTFKFKKLLQAFGVPIPMMVLLDQKHRKEEETYDTTLYEKHFYNDAQIPKDDFVRYNPETHLVVRDFLERRALDDADYYIGRSGYWANRIIVPLRWYDKLIGWEARTIEDSPHIARYEKSGFNTDMLYVPNGVIPDEPIVVEGVFDAKSIPFGVATLHSTITPKQAYHLRNKKPILLPDRKGSRFFEIAKQYGWRIIIPTYREKDANAALRRLGRLALAKELRDNIYSDLTTAELRYAMWRETDANKNKWASGPKNKKKSWRQS